MAGLRVGRDRERMTVRRGIVAITVLVRLLNVSL
jgi:hypothetical protein